MRATLALVAVALLPGTIVTANPSVSPGIHGTVWVTGMNGNSVFAGKLPGARVLVWRNIPNRAPQVIAQTVTDNLGQFSVRLGAGHYSVQVLPPAGYGAYAAPNQAVVLTATQRTATVTFCLRQMSAETPVPLGP